MPENSSDAQPLEVLSFEEAIKRTLGTGAAGDVDEPAAAELGADTSGGGEPELPDVADPVAAELGSDTSTGDDDDESEDDEADAGE